MRASVNEELMHIEKHLEINHQAHMCATVGYVQLLSEPTLLLEQTESAEVQVSDANY